MLPNAETYTLDNFEGPLDLLWHLINKNELDIYQISLIQLIRQYLSRTIDSDQNLLDRGAEFVAMGAALVWFKSKALLPKHEQTQDDCQDSDGDPRFEIIHHLVDYCLFKEAAKELANRELQQGAFYSRGIDPVFAKKNLGIDHISLEDLATLFQQILAKATVRTGTIEEDEWRVSDKIKHLKDCLKSHSSVPFHNIFDLSMSRIELIVTFLALLELMKLGDAGVIHDRTNNTVLIISRA